jgi:hypothetical protein
LLVCFEPPEQFVSYLATVTITGDRAANLTICLPLTAFSSEGSFTCHTHCDTSVVKVISERPVILTSENAVLLAKEQSLPILNVLGLTQPARAGLELTTFLMLSESTTTGVMRLITVHYLNHFIRQFYTCEVSVNHGFCTSMANTDLNSLVASA